MNDDKWFWAWFTFCAVVCLLVLGLGVWGIIYFGEHLVAYLDRH